MCYFTKFLFLHATHYLYDQDNEVFLCRDGVVRPDTHNGVERVYKAIFDNKEELNRVFCEYVNSNTKCKGFC